MKLKTKTKQRLSMLINVLLGGFIAYNLFYIDSYMFYFMILYMISRDLQTIFDIQVFFRNYQLRRELSADNYEKVNKKY